MLWEKNFHTTLEPGIPLCPPKYTKNRNVGDLLDTPDPKDEMPTVQIQIPRPSRAGVQLTNTEESEWSGIMGKE